ncbi:MAG: hypothetical protein EYC62_03225 [Alphaproteobacteria bacterium]|nr:MAG: hypothetical protein EYC62_03225 [Alphaproteobacteria bacterium]
MNNIYVRVAALSAKKRLSTPVAACTFSAASGGALPKLGIVIDPLGPLIVASCFSKLTVQPVPGACTISHIREYFITFPLDYLFNFLMITEYK